MLAILGEWEGGSRIPPSLRSGQEGAPAAKAGSCNAARVSPGEALSSGPLEQASLSCPRGSLTDVGKRLHLLPCPGVRLRLFPWAEDTWKYTGYITAGTDVCFPSPLVTPTRGEGVIGKIFIVPNIWLACESKLGAEMAASAINPWKGAPNLHCSGEKSGTTRGRSGMQ